MMDHLSPEIIPILFWMLCAPLFLLALLFEFFRRKERSLWKKLLSGILRAGALLCMGALLTNRIDSEWNVEQQSHPLLLLEDLSASMKQAGLWNGEEKKKLLELLHREQEAFSRSSSSHPAPRLLRFRFSDRLYGEDETGGEGKKPEGESGHPLLPAPGAEYATALGDALLELAHLYPGSDILLLSDGVSNTGISPFYAADLLRCSGNGVYPLLSGGEKEKDRRPPNLAIECREQADDVDAEGRLYSFTSRFENPDVSKSFFSRSIFSGAASASVTSTLSIRIDGRLLHEEVLTLTSEPLPLTRRIPDPEDLEAGWHEYEVSLSPLEGERQLSDNTAKGVFESYSGTGVLILWDRNSPELSALREIFRRRYPSAVFSYASTFAKESPARKEELVRNAVLVLLGPGCPPDLFGTDALKLLRGKLEKDELTLIFLHPGAVDSWLDTPGFGDHLPVTGKGTPQNFQPPLTEEFRLPGGEGRDAVRLPVHRLYRFPLRIPGAAVLRSAGNSGNAGKKQPMAAASEGGVPLLLSSGKCVIVAFTGSWRWKQHPERAIQQIHSAYWEDLLEKTDRFGKQGLRLVLESEHNAVLPNLCNAILTYVRGPGEKSSLLSAELERLGEAGDPESARTLQELLPQKDGTYRARFRVVTPGIHWFRAAADILLEEKGGGNERKRLFSGKVPFIVKDERLETTGSADGERILRELAARSGGRMLFLRDLEEKGWSLPPKEYTTYRRKTLPSDDGRKETLLFLSALLLLTLEWLVRKQEDNKGNA